MKRITINIFKHSTNIKDLQLSGHFITELDPNCFSNLEKLESLDLSHNELRVIKANQLNGLNNLKVLNLSYNPIAEIEENAFSNLTNLKELNMYGNNLELDKPNQFKGLVNLETLNLGYNHISVNDICSDAFAGLTNLKTLRLHLNKSPVQSILNVECLKNLNNLESLYLPENCRIEFNSKVKVIYPSIYYTV